MASTQITASVFATLIPHDSEDRCYKILRVRQECEQSVAEYLRKVARSHT